VGGPEADEDVALGADFLGAVQGGTGLLLAQREDLQ
jgi:hypothetical protein